MRQAALIMLNDQVSVDSVRIVGLLRHVAHATGLSLAGGSAILAVFEKDINEDDFRYVMLPALRALRFARSVEDTPGSFGGDRMRMKHVNALIDLVRDLEPARPNHPSNGELAEYVSELREWARTRDILLGDTCERIQHGDRDKL